MESVRREGTGSMRNPTEPLRHFPSSSRIFSFYVSWSLESPSHSRGDLRALVSSRHSCREPIKLQFTLGFNISLLLRGIGVTKRQKSLFFKQSEIIRLTTGQRERERERERESWFWAAIPRPIYLPDLECWYFCILWYFIWLMYRPVVFAFFVDRSMHRPSEVRGRSITYMHT